MTCVAFRHWDIDSVRLGRASATAATLLAAGTIAAAMTHLAFLGAFGLLLHRGDRIGTLDVDVAQAALNWRRSNEATKTETGKPDKRTRRIMNIVHPGTLKPSGPLQMAVAEICDRDEPPYYKHFLRVAVAKDEASGEKCLKITRFQSESTDESDGKGRPLFNKDFIRQPALAIPFPPLGDDTNVRPGGGGP